MKQKARIEYLEATVRQLSNDNETLAKQVKAVGFAMEEEKKAHTAREKDLQDQVIRADIEKSKGLADKMKVGQLEKQLSVINHVTAGRINEAIQEILTPLPVLFTLDVRFADDAMRIAAEDERFDKLKKIIVGAVESASIKREPAQKE